MRIQELNTLLMNTYDLIVRAESEMLRSGPLEGLSVAEIHTLEAIGRGETIAMCELAQKLHISMPTLSVCIKKLVEKGYVARTGDKGDRRRVLVCLTRNGEISERLHAMFHRKMISETLDFLTEEESEILIQALIKINAYFLTYGNGENG